VAEPAALPTLAVVGSINVDLVLRAERLPRPGETVGGARLAQLAGGKGANQAVAAARLGARVRMLGAVGDDAYGEPRRRELAAEGVDVDGVRIVAGPTGLAAIVVDDAGENQIVVAPGANTEVVLPADEALADDGVLAQLEIPLATVAEAARRARGLVCLNAAPARPLPDELVERAGLVVVNESEHALLGGLPRARLVALTLGAAGAVLYDHGLEVARADAPRVDVVDTVGAGDAFCAALAVGLLQGRDRGEALARACVAGAIAATRAGATPSLPTAQEVDAWVPSR
jgi:ribokinase